MSTNVQRQNSKDFTTLFRNDENRLSPVIPIGSWISQLFIAFYSIRCISILLPSILLTYFVAYDLFALHMPSILFVTFCWLVSTRLFHLTVLLPNQCPTLVSFMLTFLHIFFPIVRCTEYEHQQWPILYTFTIVLLKMIVSHWMHRWLLTCEGSDRLSSIETHAPFRIPSPWPWLFTQLFLLLTASLQMGPFTRIGPKYFAVNTPLLFEQNWIPKLPVPNFCP